MRTMAFSRFSCFGRTFAKLLSIPSKHIKHVIDSSHYERHAGQWHGFSLETVALQVLRNHMRVNRTTCSFQRPTRRLSCLQPELNKFAEREAKEDSSSR